MCSFLNALEMPEIRLLFRTGAGKVRQAIVERCGPLAGESFYSGVRASRTQDVVFGVTHFGGSKMPVMCRLPGVCTSGGFVHLWADYRFSSFAYLFLWSQR